MRGHTNQQVDRAGADQYAFPFVPLGMDDTEDVEVEEAEADALSRRRMPKPVLLMPLMGRCSRRRRLRSRRQT